MSGFLLAFAWIFMWCAKAIRNRHEDEKLMPNGALDGAMESAGPSAWLEEDWGSTSAAACGHVTNATNLEGLQLHCEKYLKKIRELFQVPRPEEILEMNHINLSTAEEGTGQSGAKMLFSNDKKFIIKTMSARDLGAFLNVVEKYTAYMTMHASESAMMRYYAILEDDRGGFWLIANNWLPVKFPVLFDLKGSMVGRTNGITESDQKDKDWLKQNLALVLPPGERAVALQSLKKDSLWLARAKLIDYSLIAGLLYYQLDACDGPSQAWCIAPVCHPKGGCGEAAYTLGEYFNQIKDFYCEETSVKEKQFGHTCVGGITSSLKVYFQCFGIIDLLKPFDMKSRAEYTVKAGWGRQISAQPANSYARRFDQFMVEKVFRKSWSDSTAPLVFTDQTCLDWGSIDMWGD
ncbi:Phosphatidylinositol 5-phosphate 4-kinase type-2 beta (1-phosphatidylinositol 5-phosphate 4-kinase 2-beta) (Diphosphoinositide kinase 2-beta) (Phosphatidylinositol 5-phosphate 4-kinase type II beta) (PI(5)P 4-kinase type II beta) (PIP4KII-beta) (PtdIns(5)P-4-kinase isoform 2-beta) [Durusdinium trenchii]|uniref:PIPK domain-containing protein n=1 Tax=Durusdinium trenchii TaxID=1381693 RepID=A0ABP0SQN0_9DINO